MNINTINNIIQINTMMEINVRLKFFVIYAFSDISI